MAGVGRIDRRLAAQAKPCLAPVDGSPIGQGRNLLIACAGFEDRAMECLSRSTNAGVKGLSVILVDYLPRVPSNRIDEMTSLCGAVGIRYEVVTYDRENPLGMGDDIVGRIPEGCEGIYVDISAMSRLCIVQLLVALGRSPRGFSGTRVVYAEASEYPPNQGTVRAELAKMESDPLHTMMLLSSGIFGVTVVPELSSVAMLGQPIRLVAFPSFNADQLTALRAEVHASQFTIVHGVPPLEANAWRPTAIRALNHVDEIPRCEEVESSTLDYRETFDLLLDTYDKRGMLERIVVAPTGSKMQAVAVGLFRAYMDDIQVVYPTPRSFAQPKDYTRGVRQMYQLALDSFSSIQVAGGEEPDDAESSSGDC